MVQHNQGFGTSQNKTSSSDVKGVEVRYWEWEYECEYCGLVALDDEEWTKGVSECPASDIKKHYWRCK